MDNSTRLIEKIREQQVKPLPRWRFTIKDTLVWLSFIFCVLFGALAFSVILYAIQQLDFDIARHMSHSTLELVLSLVPYIWIITLIIFLIIAIVSIKNSKKGYRFTAPSLVGFATGLSILVGTLFFISGGAGWLENAFANKISIYEGIDERKEQIWSMPEDGYLSGTIISAGDNMIDLKDLKGKYWKVSYEGADMVPAVHLTDGEMIKMMGKMTSDNTFRADMIRPWGGFQRRHHGGRNGN